MWCWGYNAYGQLGDGTTDDRLLPTRVQSLHDVEQITMGFHFACALLADRSVWCWGDNEYQQLGINAKNWKEPLPVRVEFDVEPDE